MPRYDEQEAREAVAGSRSYSEALRRLGLRPAGGNFKLFKHYVDEVWRLPTVHFDAGASARSAPSQTPTPLVEVLVEGSTYSRGKLKERLYLEGYKERVCEICGQGEEWRGRSMSLVLDHINGIPDDNRLENLRIVCPNCAATLDTTADARTDASRSCANAGAAGVSSPRNTRGTATAPTPAVAVGIVRRCVASRSPSYVGSNALRARD